MIAISGKASSASRVPSVPAAKAAHNHPKSRPIASHPARPARSPTDQRSNTRIPRPDKQRPVPHDNQRLYTAAGSVLSRHGRTLRGRKRAGGRKPEAPRPSAGEMGALEARDCVRGAGRRGIM
ncbi:hypothetical protein GCM10023259_090400 [Thermocatellispora tengchongensis]